MKATIGISQILFKQVNHCVQRDQRGTRWSNIYWEENVGEDNFCYHGIVIPQPWCGMNPLCQLSLLLCIWIFLAFPVSYFQINVYFWLLNLVLQVYRFQTQILEGLDSTSSSFPCIFCFSKTLYYEGYDLTPWLGAIYLFFLKLNKASLCTFDVIFSPLNPNCILYALSSPILAKASKAFAMDHMRENEGHPTTRLPFNYIYGS